MSRGFAQPSRVNNCRNSIGAFFFVISLYACFRQRQSPHASLETPSIGSFFYSSSLKTILMTTTCIQWRQSRQTVWQPLLFISLPVLFISRLPSLTTEGRSFYFVVSLIQSIVYSENGQSTCVALWCCIPRYFQSWRERQTLYRFLAYWSWANYGGPGC